MSITANTKAPTKTEMIEALATSSGLEKKQVSAVLDSLTDYIYKVVGTAGLFKLPGVVQFKRVRKEALPERQGRNPGTGEMTTFAPRPASTSVKAIALKGIKDAVK